MRSQHSSGDETDGTQQRVQSSRAWWLPEDHADHRRTASGGARKSEHHGVFEARARSPLTRASIGSNWIAERGGLNGRQLGAHAHHIHELEESVDALTIENDDLKRQMRKQEVEVAELRSQLTAMTQKYRDLSSSLPQMQGNVGQVQGASLSMDRLHDLRTSSLEDEEEEDEETAAVRRSTTFEHDDCGLKGTYRGDSPPGRSDSPRRASSESTRAGSDAKSSQQMEDEEYVRLVTEVVHKTSPKARFLIQKLQDAGVITKYRREQTGGPNVKEKEQERAINGLKMESIAYQAKVVKMKEEIIKLHREVTAMKTEVRSKSAVARDLEAQRDELRAMLDSITQDFRRLHRELEAERMQLSELKRRTGSSAGMAEDVGGAVAFGGLSIGRPELLSALDDLDMYDALDADLDRHSEPETTGSVSRRQGRADYQHLYERTQAELEATRKQLQELLKRGGEDIEAELKKLKREAELEDGEQKTPAERMRDLLSLARKEVGLASMKLRKSSVAT
eukprot:CAMPEP_0176055700 /NCGR_PEP_ID=MMETSP0120_2-20121206/27733_1 /TAXON_ID=160619 /ORGANISM="Kryptoperidinium foliaceum, Strain CCMP 1326" /LENGTH=507 /DNA_ID=CAMNT_0017389199 /DNA_START=26 /DNA_END=1549 /DNA_ORIENTATION=-